MRRTRSVWRSGAFGDSVVTATVVVFITRVALGAIFLWSGIEKARKPRAFFVGIQNYRVLPSRVAPFAGVALIGVELVVGAWLISGAAVVQAAVAAAIVLVVMAGAVAFNLLRGRRVPCHCFGADGSELISAMTLVRVTALFAGAVAIVTVALPHDVALFPSSADLVPSLAIAVSFVAAMRFLGLLPAAWDALHSKPVLMPTPTRKVTFKHQPLNVSLLRGARPVADGNVAAAGSGEAADE